MVEIVCSCGNIIKIDGKNVKIVKKTLINNNINNLLCPECRKIINSE